MSRTYARNILLTAAGVAGSLAAIAVHAQSSPAGSAARANAGSDLEEIVVTARRREESLQTVPVSASVFNAESLANQGIQSTTDLQRLVPGVVLNGGGSDANTTYTIRGQGKAVFGPGLPSVISYFNEVPLGSWGSVVPTFDVSNVQILKGPQGTLFGRNTTGGAFLVYSAPPTFDFGGYFEAQFGNYNDHSFQGAINLPLIDQILAIRLAGDVERRDGYATNISTGQKENNKNSDAFRFSGFLKPAAWFTNSLVFDYYRSHDRNEAIAALAPPLNPALAPSIAAVQASSPYNVASTVTPLDRVKTLGVGNTTKIELGHLTFKNIFGYRTTDVYQINSGSGLAAVPLPLDIPSLGLTPGTPGILINTNTVHADRQYTDEVQLSGTALGESLNWLVGGFYLDDAPNGPTYLTLDLYRPTQPSPTTSFIVNNFLGGIWPIGSQADSLYTDKSKAVFTSFTYDLSRYASFLEGVTLNAGVRYTWDTEGVCASQRPSTLLSTGASVVAGYTSLKQCEADQGGFINSPANTYFPSYVNSVDFHAPTHTLGVDYKLNDAVFFYFTTRRGYRAGGLNTPALAPVLSAFQSYVPQTVTDYEIGTHDKWQAGNWRGRFNLALYTASYTNLQLQATGISPGSIPGVTTANAPSNTLLTINAGTSTVKGAELDGLISPFRALDFLYAASYLDPKYDNLNVPSILAPFFSSGPFTNAPRWSYTTELRYHLPVHPLQGEVVADANYYHIGHTFYGFTPIPAYGLANFTLQWSNFSHQPIDLTLFVNNAFNTRYIHDVLLSSASFGLYAGSYGAPRTFGVRLRYTFGDRGR
jgi:iron complex outermembrane receptor protein